MRLDVVLKTILFSKKTAQVLCILRSFLPYISLYKLFISDISLKKQFWPKKRVFLEHCAWAAFSAHKCGVISFRRKLFRRILFQLKCFDITYFDISYFGINYLDIVCFVWLRRNFRRNFLNLKSQIIVIVLYMIMKKVEEN